MGKGIWKKIFNIKENINDYNIASENIKTDINKYKKKALNIQKNNCKCDICQKEIENRNIFLFPCRHLFDMYYLKTIFITLWSYLVLLSSW